MVAMAVDPSRGSILSLLVQAPTYTERVQQGGLIGYITIALGLFGLGIVVVRFRVLWNTGRAMKAQESSDKADPGNPLGRVMQVYEEYGTADTETLELKLDESILKDAPKLERGLTTIKVLSIIAPLLGLLGTVTGMILTFQQITLFGTGDPKMMAGGISQALVTTMLGLTVAIPLTLLHSWLRDRSKALIQVLEEESAGMVARRAEAEQSR
jgi:biopolymer transport protein ExbB